MKKIIFIIIDGLGDRSIPDLGNRTPLEAARTPNLNLLAKKGVCGLVEPFLFSWQEEPKSDTSHLALFGYDPGKYYLGRGPYEAAGIGIRLKEEKVYLRVNFATVDDNLKVIDRRAGRIINTQPLIKGLLRIKIKGVKHLLKKSYGHRAVLTLSGKGLSANVSDNDPRKTGRKVEKVLPKDGSPESKFTAKVLNEFLEKSYQVLKKHSLNEKRIERGLLPANYLLLRGAGQLRKTPGFQQRYRLRACCIAGGALYKGIAKILGMDLIKVRGATGFPTTNLKWKFLAAKKALKRYGFIFLHIKAADSLAEDGNYFGKKEFIAKIDKNIKPLTGLENTIVVVTADHSTCCQLKSHCLEPVPILIFGTQGNGIEKFSENGCKKGKLGKIRALELMPKLLDLASS